MALQTGVASSKVLILVGAGLTGSIILRNGKLSDLIVQLQELIKGVDEIEIVPGKYDTVLLASQIKQLAQEIRELTMSRPVTIFNGDSSSRGGLASFIMPAAALGAMGYCYMWWKGLSFSDVMFVTKQNMANAVATVSKQLENVNEALASTKRHLSKRLESLDWKLDEQKEISNQIANEVSDVKSDLSQISFDINAIQEMITGLEGKIDHLESKQDLTNSGLWYLCHWAEGVKDGLNARLCQDDKAKLIKHSEVTFEENSLKGLQFLMDSNEPNAAEKSVPRPKQDDSVSTPAKSVTTMKTKIHRTYSVDITLPRGLSGIDV
ncbi:protein of unknown function DUF1664 [Dillenia turbinata]|uniref:DUF1664 domain-containing protein n=1 Tax=Dillenia turbinata TaxID=194707 RepID=A0AAN8UZU4_9MAGN